MTAGDAEVPVLTNVASGQAIEDVRARVEANAAQGLVARGEIETAARITSSGENTVVVQDCYLNNLAQGSLENGEEVINEPSGHRRPVTVTVSRTRNGWQVTEVDGPQIRGPHYQSAASCAPPELEKRLIAAYERYWDVMDEAGDPGGGQPADPTHFELERVAVDPQLSDSRAFLPETRDAGHVVRGRPDTAPAVLAVYDGDTVATVVDCSVVPQGSGIFDASSGEAVSRDDAGSRSYESTTLVRTASGWKVKNWDIVEDDTGEPRECTRPGA